MLNRCEARQRLAVLLAGAGLALFSPQLHAGQAAPRKAPSHSRSEARTGKPNFVILLADDLGLADLGFNGRREFRTPNLDRLSREGTVFERFYAGGVVCGPSRASLLTGRYTIHNGVSSNSADLPRSETTIAEALKPLGYRTGLFGKWHGGRPRTGEARAVHPMEQGFDEFIGYLDPIDAWQHFPTALWFGHERRAVKGYSPDLVTDYGIDFVRRRVNEPFFLYLSYVEPHLKIEAPEEDVRRHAGKIEEADPNRPYNATYAAMVERLDAAVGRLLAELDRQGLSRNTIVLFSSDHGATFESGNLGASADLDSNRPFRGGKRSVYEGGTRVPTVIRWTGHIPAGKRSDAMLSHLDILPTFMAAAGAKPDPAWGVDGLDELAVWQGKAKPADRTLFWEFRDENWYNLAAMRGDWKLVVENRNQFQRLPGFSLASLATVLQAQEAIERRMAGAGAPAAGAPNGKSSYDLFGTFASPQLFDLAKDPGERRNYLFTRPEISARLRGDLIAWLKTESAASKEAFPVASAEPSGGLD